MSAEWGLGSNRVELEGLGLKGNCQVKWGINWSGKEGSGNDILYRDELVKYKQVAMEQVRDGLF